MSLSGESEKIIGYIPVNARLAIGIEQLILFVTDARIIVAHIGKRGAGALATSALFGRLSGGFEDALKSGTESRAKKELPSLTPHRILSANKDNFHMAYSEIVSVRLVEMPYTSSEMTLLTKDDKFDFRTSHPLDAIVKLLGTFLGPKLSVEWLPPSLRPGQKR